MARSFPLLLTLSLLLLLLQSQARVISTVHHDQNLNLLLSDGLAAGADPSSTEPLSLFSSSNEAEKCEQTYGFLPCTTTVAGNLFLAAAYGFLMYKAATFLSSGSELLLEILGPGLVGGLFLPILGALPDAMLILVSGLSGSKETAQKQVLIGMGLLAGSTVMLLTILWGSCIVVGKCDLSDNSTSIDLQDTKGFSLFGSGITTDVQTSYAARIMAISIIPFIIVQLPRIFRFKSERLMILLALIASAALVLSYCLYQVFQPWIQKRKIAYAKHKHVISGILRHAQLKTLGRLLTSDGEPDIHVIKKLFCKIDLDANNLVSCSELSAFVIGINFEEVDLDQNDAVDKVMDDFDTSGDNNLEESEFIMGITKWLDEAKRTVGASGVYSEKFIHDFHMIYGGVTMNNTLCLAVFLALVYVRHLTWDFSAEVLIILLVCIVMGIFTSFRTTFPLWTFLVAFLLYPLSLLLVYVLDFIFGWS